MKSDQNNIDEYLKLREDLLRREKQENSATANLTTESLSKLNVSIDTLPQKCQQLLQRLALTQDSIQNIDPIALSLQHSRETLTKLEEEYEILKLKQKNVELQVKIDRNKTFLEDLRKALECSKESLATRSVNPDNVQDFIRQLKQKVASYEETLEKAKTKFTKLNVPEALYPKSISVLISTLASLKAEEVQLQQRAEDILLAREARNTINRLMK